MKHIKFLVKSLWLLSAKIFFILGFMFFSIVVTCGIARSPISIRVGNNSPADLSNLTTNPYAATFMLIAFIIFIIGVLYLGIRHLVNEIKKHKRIKSPKSLSAMEFESNE